MKLIDLTHPIARGIAIFPGDDPIELEQVRTLERDGFNNFKLCTGMHVGTHLDGPMHMTNDQRFIGNLPPDRFAGKGVIIDVRGMAEIKMQERYRTMILPESIVLFYSGLDVSFGKAGYFTTYPDISETLAWFLVEQKVKMIGIDWVSPDHHPYPIHEILLNHDILILENLTHLDQLMHEPDFEVFAFPLRIAADSSPVRAVARVNF